MSFFCTERIFWTGIEQSLMVNWTEGNLDILNGNFWTDSISWTETSFELLSSLYFLTGRTTSSSTLTPTRFRSLRWGVFGTINCIVVHGGGRRGEHPFCNVRTFWNRHERTVTTPPPSKARNSWASMITWQLRMDQSHAKHRVFAKKN